jgi:hypothetical protein
MTRLAIVIPAALGVVLAWSVPPGRSLADDPLKAMPTAEDSTEAKVKRLTEAELQTIVLPEQGDQVVLSIAYHPPATQQNESAEQPELWLRVYADGRIDCPGPMQANTQRCTDDLTSNELLWLLHLTVNECQGLVRSTDDIQADYEVNGQPKSAGDSPYGSYHYHVFLTGKANDFAIPVNALITRPLRARMKLNAFASLHTYANYLTARATLGKPPERTAILQALNEQLKLEHPEAPPFLMEHLVGSTSIGKLEVPAMFTQVVDLGGNKFREWSGQIIRREPDAEPTFSIRTKEFSKYRP